MYELLGYLFFIILGYLKKRQGTIKHTHTCKFVSLTSSLDYSFFIIINMHVRASLYVPQLISRVLKLTILNLRSDQLSYAPQNSLDYSYYFYNKLKLQVRIFFMLSCNRKLFFMDTLDYQI
jgi:hypothetical protein